MNSVCSSQLAGVGHYAPEQRITNAQMEEMLRLETGWIERRTGIKTRRWAKEHETLVDLAEQAGKAALDHAGVARDEIALTILATSTPDRLLPPSAPLLAHRLGLSSSGAFDLSGACTGFIYALTVADSFVRAQRQPVLIVAANILSRRINFAEPGSAILFGDAAGAIILAPCTDPDKGLLGISFCTDGGGHDLISIAAGGSERPFSPEIPAQDYKMTMQDGQAVFSQAVEMMERCSILALRNANLLSANIDRLVPHQANARIAELLARKLVIPAEKSVSIINEYGNTSAAGIPLALSLANQTREFATGEKLLLTAAGAGMTGGAVVFSI